MHTQFEVPIEKSTRNEFKNSRKRLINREKGLGYDVEPGVSWRKIALEILKDGTQSSNLIKVAKGELKMTNGWEVIILR